MMTPMTVACSSQELEVRIAAGTGEDSCPMENRTRRAQGPRGGEVETSRETSAGLAPGGSRYWPQASR